MRADPVVARRVVGTASLVLLLGLLMLGLEARFDRAGTYEVQAELGRAGSGLRAGNDVKLRGVSVGQVLGVRIADDGEATATLQLENEPRLPDDVAPVVTPKTFLGEKQVELRTDRSLEEPYLEPGTELVAPSELQPPTEPVAVVDDLGVFLREIDEDKLAALVDALAAFDEDDADLFAEGIETGAQLAAFLARTAPQQLERMGDAARAFDALAGSADELTRVARALPDGVAPLVDNQDQLRRTTEAIGPFAETLGEFLRVEEETFGDLLAVGDRIGRVVDPRMHEIGSMVHGIYRYALMFGQEGGPLDDGSEFANFRAFLGEEGQFLRLCEELPEPLAEAAPGCRVEGEA